MNELNRRDFIKSSALIGSIPFLYPTFAHGMMSSKAKTDQRLVVIILRGGMDSLSAVIPYGDREYYSKRGKLAIDADKVLRLDNYFGFHPSLEPFHKLYKNKELSVIHSTALPYRNRSHFDSQNVLELGSDRPNSTSDGWLNRLVGEIDNSSKNLGLSLGQIVPLIMRGDNKVSSWAPSALPKASGDLTSLVQNIYSNDPLFRDNFSEAIKIKNKASNMLSANREKEMTARSRSPQSIVLMSRMAGKWLSEKDGPRIATLEMGGWDTHAAQGSVDGKISNNFKTLSRGITALKQSLGKAWENTTIVTMTEFGRTVAMNGTNGTDHGTASCMFVMGGAVNGGQILSDWSGLQDTRLYEGRDLMPTTDSRSVLKGIIRDVYGINIRTLDNFIFPNSYNAKPMIRLIKT